VASPSPGAGVGGGGGSGRGGVPGSGGRGAGDMGGQLPKSLSPFRHPDGRVVNGLRASPATPGVPRVDSSDRLYQQLHEPFIRNLEDERSTGLSRNSR
jgi:hypothetical protein